MKLIEFYTTILTSFGLHVSEDKFIQRLTADDDYVDLTKHKGLRVALPTKENLKNMYAVDKTGKFKKAYLVFNPLSEHNSEDGIGLEILMEQTKINLAVALRVFAELSLITYNNPKIQRDLPMALNEFIADAKDNTVPGMKSTGKAIDDTTLKHFVNLYKTYLTTPEKELFSLVIPRTKRGINKDTNTREARLICNMWNDIKTFEGTEENVKLNGVTLRPKDVKIYLDIFNIFMVDANEKGAVIAGTKDTDAPGFIALTTLYHNILSKVNHYIASMHNADPALATEGQQELLYTIEEINQSPIFYKPELLKIPTENEVNLGSDVANETKGVNLNVKNLHPSVQEAVKTTQEYQEQVAQLEPDEPKDGMQAILQKRNMDYTKRMTQFQPGYRPMMQPMTSSVPMVQPSMSSAPKMVARLNPNLNDAQSQAILANERAHGMQMGVTPMQPTMQPMMAMPQMVPMQPMYPQMQVNLGMMPQMGMQPMGMVSPYGNTMFR